MQAIALGILSLIFAIGLGVLTSLKETPEFWTHAGGYPVGLRHLILHFYYPTLLAYLLFLASFTTRGLNLSIKGDCGKGLLYLLALAPAWLITAFNIGLLVANNVVNLLEGNPLHTP
ncbi:MAG: hypothetical protein JJT96_20435 [Opitutales bacterium]|nr:hypothetical protein [Opitutales bacterium]